MSCRFIVVGRSAYVFRPIIDMNRAYLVASLISRSFIIVLNESSISTRFGQVTNQTLAISGPPDAQGRILPRPQHVQQACSTHGQQSLRTISPNDKPLQSGRHSSEEPLDASKVLDIDLSPAYHRQRAQPYSPLSELVAPDPSQDSMGCCRSQPVVDPNDQTLPPEPDMQQRQDQQQEQNQEKPEALAQKRQERRPQRRQEKGREEEERGEQELELQESEPEDPELERDRDQRQERRTKAQQEREKQERDQERREREQEMAGAPDTLGISSNSTRPGEAEQSPNRLNDGLDLTSSTSSTKVEAPSTALSTAETFTPSTPITREDVRDEETNERAASETEPPEARPTTSNSSANTVQPLSQKARALNRTVPSASPTTGTTHAIPLVEIVPMSVTTGGDDEPLLAPGLEFLLNLGEEEDSPAPPPQSSGLLGSGVGVGVDQLDGAPTPSQLADAVIHGQPDRQKLSSSKGGILPASVSQRPSSAGEKSEPGRRPMMTDDLAPASRLEGPPRQASSPATSSSQTPTRPAPTTSQSSPQPETGVWGANKASFAEVLKKTGNQPVQPVKRPPQSHSSQKPPSPARASSSPAPRGRGGKTRHTPARLPVKTSTSVPSKPRETPSRGVEAAPPDDSEIAQLSPTAVRDYFLDPANSRLTLESVKYSELLDRIDFTDRLVDIETAAFGGLSDVKKGRIHGSSDLVAIKVLRAGNMGMVTQELGGEQRQRLRKRLAREMRIWILLRHPRILVLLGFAFLDDRPCLLSPWYQNGNAKEYLGQNPGADRKAMVVQAAEGLIYLHSRNPVVVHADLKPVNILVTDGGDAVICDFGISKQPGEASTGLTTSQNAFMSLRYAAPEILQNFPPSTKSDVYGFGCVALELFTGQCPHFNVTNTAALITRILQGPMSDPAEYPMLLATSPLWDFFRKCWTTDPEERPGMQEAHDELVAI